MGVTELADHSDSVRNVNTMIMSVFNENEQRSLQTTIPKKYMGNKKYQKGVPLQWKKDIVQYATSVADYAMPIASYGWKNEECLVCFYRHIFFSFFFILETHASAIETRDHTARFRRHQFLSEFYHLK
jgi:hypothetical protein